MTDKRFAFLSNEDGPKMLIEARALIGTIEGKGDKNSPAILAWADYLGAPFRNVYSADTIPWCGLFMAYVAKRAGKPVHNEALWARSWLRWGFAVKGAPQLGDTLIFSRPKGRGHVGLYVAEDPTSFYVLGGNQSDAVSIARLSRKRFLGARNHYRYAAPENVRRVHVEPAGKLSTNEQ